MDFKQSELVERYQNSKLKKHDNPDEESGSEDDDELLEMLDDDNDPALTRIRDERMAALKKEFNRIDESTADNEFGEIITVSTEKQLMDLVTANDTVMVHFYQANFEKCQKMNDKLKILAEKHLIIKILAIEAKDAPFLVTKLGIKMLPFVVIYRQAKEVERLVGFEKLGNDANDFKYEALEQFLYSRNVINRKTINFGSIRQRVANEDEDEDDFDI